MNEHNSASAQNQKTTHQLFLHKVESDRAGQRLDNYLIAKTKLPKSLIYNLLRRGKIRVDGKKKDPSYRIDAEDQLTIPAQYVVETNSSSSAPKTQLRPEQVAWIDGTIIEENDHFLVVNKPSGLASHGGSGHSLGLIEVLRLRYPKKTFELVHRLDKDTSGIMVIAKKRSALRALNEKFAQRAMQKIYLAVLSGVCRHKEVIDAPLNISRQQGIRKAFVDHKEGVTAQTTFIPLGRHLGKSLCLVIPETGRMHQIRAHAHSMGLPIRGDVLYQGEEADKLYLHAAKLSFEYLDKKWIFEQSPPDFWEEEFFNGRSNLWKTINKHLI